MIEFVYNNVKNTSKSNISFELNYRYYFRILFENKTNFYSRFCSAYKLAKEIIKLTEIYYQNLLYIQEL